MVSNRVIRKWTVEEYLAYEEESGIRHEYIDGEIFAMAGGSENHSLITGNTFMAVGQAVRGSFCRMHTNDIKIKVSETKYVYPDFSVVCGEAQFADNKRDMLTNPTLCVEVTSPSTADYDKGLKVDLYRSIPTLQHYLIIDQDKIDVKLYSRVKKGWLLQDFIDIEDVLSLKLPQVELPLSEIYRDIKFTSTS